MNTELLQKMIDRLGLAAVAEIIGYDKTAVCHVARGTYRANPERILRAVEEKFSEEPVECPVLGTITLARCVAERSKPFVPVNPVRVQLAKACRRCGK